MAAALTIVKFMDEQPGAAKYQLINVIVAVFLEALSSMEECDDQD